jgi:NADH-quinone oxidoreductase subunit H
MSPLALSTLSGLGVIGGVLGFTALGLWLERKVAARMQTRIGPNMVGFIGLLQPVADVVKLLQKEDIIPEKADRGLFNVSPVIAAVTALAVVAVVPFSATIVGADLDVGVLFILALGAVNVLPVVGAGWSSHNKFALLGGMRAVAQSVSYEVPLVLTALVPVVLSGSMKVSDIVRYQVDHHWLVVWPFFLGVPAFVIFFLAMLAEANRIPFDIPEAESELVAGVTTEYSGMKFALFYMGEYIHTVVASAVASALFLGGWDGPFAPGLHWMVLKTVSLFVLVYWVRWSLLRFRSDQLMDLCWRVLVPTGVALVAATAVYVNLVGT